MGQAYLQYGGEQKFHLEPGRLCHIGRSLANEVVVQDAEVSRHHATVEAKQDHFILSDAGSRNGTFLNGAKINGIVKLKPGDRIEVGNTQITFEWPGAAPAAPDFHEEATIATTMMPPTQLTLVLTMNGFASLAQNADSSRLNGAIETCRHQVTEILRRERIQSARYAGDLVILTLNDEGGLGKKDLLDRALRAASDIAIALEQLPAHAAVIGRIQVSGGLWLQEFAPAEGSDGGLKNAIILAGEASRGGAAMQFNAAAVQRLRKWHDGCDQFLMEPAGTAVVAFPGSASMQFFHLQSMLQPN